MANYRITYKEPNSLAHEESLDERLNRLSKTEFGRYYNNTSSTIESQKKKLIEKELSGIDPSYYTIEIVEKKDPPKKGEYGWVIFAIRKSGGITARKGDPTKKGVRQVKKSSFFAHSSGGLDSAKSLKSLREEYFSIKDRYENGTGATVEELVDEMDMYKGRVQNLLRQIGDIDSSALQELKSNKAWNINWTKYIDAQRLKTKMTSKTGSSIKGTQGNSVRGKRRAIK